MPQAQRREDRAQQQQQPQQQEHVNQYREMRETRMAKTGESEPQPLTPIEYQRMNELLAKSQTEKGLTQDEYDELEDLHEQATAYASNWSADPEQAFESALSGMQALANAVRLMADLSPVGHALDPAMKRVDAALLASGRAVHEPEPIPEMPPPPGSETQPPPNGSGTPAAPVNRDVPHVTGNPTVGSSLNCTMGNWDNMEAEPHSYAYRWQADGTQIGGSTADYMLTEAERGKSVTCVVTATNAQGQAEAPPSNAVQVQ